MPPIEQPTYVLPQSIKRALIPKIVTFLVLGAVFYLGILLNVSLLELRGSEETIVKTISLILLLLVVVIGIYLAFHRAHLKYIFFRNRITFNKKEMYYTNIRHVQVKQDLFDKIFQTHSYDLGEEFFLKHVPANIDLNAYLQQMIAYAHANAGS